MIHFINELFTFIDAMMENGASGYLLKNAYKEEITAAIRDVAEGKTFLEPDTQKKRLCLIIETASLRLM